MKTSHVFLAAVALCVPLAACGHKGRLKTPTQIEKDEAKKAKKAEKAARETSEQEPVDAQPISEPEGQ